MDFTTIVTKLFGRNLDSFELELLQHSFNLFFIGLDINLLKRLKTKVWKNVLFPLIEGKLEEIKQSENLADIVALCWEFKFTLFLVVIMGNDTQSFLTKAKKTREDIEANSFVSIFSTLPNDVDGLKSYLLKWVASEDPHLQYVLNYWDKIPTEFKSKSPKSIQDNFIIPVFSGYSSKELATEAFKWLVPENLYHEIEVRWLSSQSKPSFLMKPK